MPRVNGPVRRENRIRSRCIRGGDRLITQNLYPIPAPVQDAPGFKEMLDSLTAAATLCITPSLF